MEVRQLENLSKKVGYLKGLMEGMDIDGNTANGKLMAGIIDLLTELSDRVEAMDEVLDDLNDYVESIDDDLAALEGDRGDDDFNFLDDDEDEDFDDAFGDGEDKLHLLRPDDDDDRMQEDRAQKDILADDEATDVEADDEEAAGDALAGKLCPQCSRMFFTSLDDGEEEEYVCPHCGEHIHPVPLTPENAPIARPVDDE